MDKTKQIIDSIDKYTIRRNSNKNLSKLKIGGETQNSYVSDLNHNDISSSSNNHAQSYLHRSEIKNAEKSVDRSVSVTDDTSIKEVKSKKKSKEESSLKSKEILTFIMI